MSYLVEPIQILLGAFQIVSQDLQEFLDAIMTRDDILDLPIDQISLLFASISRYFSLHDLDRTHFEAFKTKFGKIITNADLDSADVLALVIPVAAEGINDAAVWDRFADVILSKEHKIGDFFQSCTNLAWAFTKVEY